MAYRQMYFNGNGTGTYGIYISSDTYLNAPAIDYTEYQVPARNGALVQYNNRLNNIIRKFVLFMPRFDEDKFRQFKHDLYQIRGYMRIESDYDSDTYQYGYLTEELSAVPFMADDNLQATIDVYFSCKPQKYFKTNTSATSDPSYNSRIPMILPRNHEIVQKALAAIPAGDTPNDEAFLLYLVNGSNNTAAVTSLTATVTEYDSYHPLEFNGFMAAVFVTYITGGWWQWDSLITYTSTGSISFSGSKAPTAAANVYLLLPAGTIGTINSSATRGSTYTRTDDAMPVIELQRTEPTEGLSYTIDMSAQALYFKDNALPTTLFVEGKNATTREIYFQGVISIYGDNLHDFLTPNQAATLSIDLQIDSETLDAKVKLHSGTEWQNANSCIGIFGAIDGRADMLNVFYYQDSSMSYELDEFDVEPRWWTI